MFPGSFDPFTIGHENIVNRGLDIFDEIVVAVGYNAKKDGFLPLENRLRLIREVFKDETRVKVSSYTSLTVEYAKEVKATYLLRGLRTSADFEYERAIAQVNKLMNSGVESVFLLTAPEYTPIASTIVRDIIRHDGDVSRFMPKGIDYRKYLPK